MTEYFINLLKFYTIIFFKGSDENAYLRRLHLLSNVRPNDNSDDVHTNSGTNERPHCRANLGPDLYTYEGPNDNWVHVLADARSEFCADDGGAHRCAERGTDVGADGDADVCADERSHHRSKHGSDGRANNGRADERAHLGE